MNYKDTQTTKRNRKTIYEQNEKLNKEIATTKKTEILELKNTMTALKNSIESFSSRLNHSK